MRKVELIFCMAMFFPLLFSACTNSSSSTSVLLLSRDFGVQTIDNNTFEVQINTDCDEQMTKALCVSEKEQLGYDEDCSIEKVTIKQLEGLKNIVRQLPPFHKKVMCHLNRIQIQDKIFSIGYATVIRNSDDKAVGNMMGVRSEVLTGNEIQNDLLSWKEQLNFGLSELNDPERKVALQGIYVTETLPVEYSIHLPTIIHELNHIIDYMNGANQFDFNLCNTDSKDRHLLYCKIPESSFSRLSWGSVSAEIISYPEDTEEDLNKIEIPPPAWSKQWPFIGKLCFYYCKETQSVNSIPLVYAELAESDFTTSYSSQSGYEDFAEAATYHALDQVGIPFQYKIHDPEGKVYFDGYQHFLSEAVKTKRDWLKRFFAKDLKYQVSPQ